MTTGVVTFVPKDFKVRYPEFGTLVDPLLTAYFNEACLFLDNTTNSRVDQTEMRQPLLWLLTAYIAALNGGVNGQAPSQLVGRVDSATEGSVSVTAALDVAPGTAQWYSQTKYGAEFWALTSGLRRMRYVGRFWPNAVSPPVVFPWPWCR